MSKLPLILIGGGGHCRSCIDVIKLEGKFSIEGIIDAKEKMGEMISGYPVLGDDSLIPEYAAKEYFFLITVGQIKSADVRKKLFEQVKNTGAKIATVVSPRAYVSPQAIIKEGTIVLHGAIVNTEVTIGYNTIINSLALVEHDTVIGDHVHVSTGSLINGGCSVGNETFIGSGSVVANNVHIANNIIIGAGSVIINDIQTPGIYAGAPVKKL